MKKNPKVRLTLHRETLGTLAGADVKAAQGGSLTSGKSACRTCGCPVLTDGCPTRVQNCTALC